MTTRIQSLLKIFLSFAALLLLWQLASVCSDVNPTLFPGPLKVLEALKELVESGLGGSSSDATLPMHIGSSMQRFLFGYLLAACSAILLGLLLGWSQSVWAFINPVVQLLRPIAPVAWLPFLVLLVGIGDTPAIAIIFIAGFFPILLATVSAVRNMDPIYRKVAQNFGLNQIELLARIVFPAIFPQIIASLHQALSTCWIFLVSGEMVGSQSGLGFLVMDAKNCIRADALLATMLVIGLIGLLLDLLIGKLEKLIALKWGLGITKYIGEEGD